MEYIDKDKLDNWTKSKKTLKNIKLSIERTKKIIQQIVEKTKVDIRDFK